MRERRPGDLVRAVRERRPGDSAVDAVRRQFLERVDSRAPSAGVSRLPV
ncbi:hypothetical protein ACFXAW_19370 [Streptomyces sp. NPDC059445]